MCEYMTMILPVSWTHSISYINYKRMSFSWNYLFYIYYVVGSRIYPSMCMKMKCMLMICRITCMTNS